MKFTNVWGNEIEVEFRKSRYANNNNLYVGAYSVDEDGYVEPYCNITVNFEEALPCSTFAWLDTNNCDKGLLKLMEEKEYIIPLYSARQSGFCTYWLYEFTKEFLDNIPELG